MGHQGDGGEAFASTAAVRDADTLTLRRRPTVVVTIRH
jgi:hypothetical protein